MLQYIARLHKFLDQILYTTCYRNFIFFILETICLCEKELIWTAVHKLNKIYRFYKIASNKKPSNQAPSTCATANFY